MGQTPNVNYVTVGPQELKELLMILIAAKEPFLIEGPPGCGKSSISAQAGRAIGYNNQFFIHPVYGDQTLLAGMPIPDLDNQKISWLPYGDMERVLRAVDPTLLILDDLGSCTTLQQVGAMQLVLERQTASGHRLPDCVSIGACTNGREHKSGVGGMIEALKSRFTTIIHLLPNIDATKAWGIKNNWDRDLLGYLVNNPSALYEFEPTPDMTNSPEPRTWEAVSRMMKAGVPEHLEYAAFSGAVGKGRAHELIGHRRMAEKMPTMEEMILHPDTVKLPDEPSMIYSMCAGLAMVATKKNFKSVYRIAERLAETERADMGFMLLHDCVTNKQELCNTPEYIDMQSRGDFGRRVRNLQG